MTYFQHICTVMMICFSRLFRAENSICMCLCLPKKKNSHAKFNLIYFFEKKTNAKNNTFKIC